MSAQPPAAPELAHPTSESADPRSRRGNPEWGQSRPKNQASAFMPTTRRSEPCTPPRRPAHHRAEPQTTNTRCTRQQPALRGSVESGAVPVPSQSWHLGCAAVRATAQPRALAGDPVPTACVGSAPVYRPCEAYRREQDTSAQVIGNGSEPPTADSRTCPGRLRRRRTAGRQPGHRRRGEREKWARVTWRRCNDVRQYNAEGRAPL